MTVNKTADLDKRTLCLSPLCLVLIKTNWVVNLVCSQQTLISAREREQEGETIFRGESRGKQGGTVNHCVHMEECHLVNMVPGRLMILAGEQASHRPRRKRLSPTITPALSVLCSRGPQWLFQWLVTDYRSAKCVQYMLLYYRVQKHRLHGLR